MTRLRIRIAAVLSLAIFLAGCGSSPSPVTRAANAVAPPVAISIPSLSKQSSLVRLGLNPDKTVQVPDVHTPEQAGWYVYSAKPGDPGPAVILGHIDGDHKFGIFHELAKLKLGAGVIIERSDGTKLNYVVTRVHRADKDEFPTDEVYGNTPESELRLITCGGAWEGGQTGYADNIIVNARLN